MPLYFPVNLGDNRETAQGRISGARDVFAHELGQVLPKKN